jgi:hypothetical protein
VKQLKFTHTGRGVANGSTCQYPTPYARRAEPGSPTSSEPSRITPSTNVDLIKLSIPYSHCTWTWLYSPSPTETSLAHKPSQNRPPLSPLPHAASRRPLPRDHHKNPPRRRRPPPPHTASVHLGSCCSIGRGSRSRELDLSQEGIEKKREGRWRCCSC